MKCQHCGRLKCAIVVLAVTARSTWRPLGLRRQAYASNACEELLCVAIAEARNHCRATSMHRSLDCHSWCQKLITPLGYQVRAESPPPYTLQLTVSVPLGIQIDGRVQLPVLSLGSHQMPRCALKKLMSLQTELWSPERR